jgi:hypothetical protein
VIKRILVTVVAALALALASAAPAEVVQSGPLRVGFTGKITPNKLPRRGRAPIKVSVGTTIASKGKTVPQLHKLEIAINKNGAIDPTGLPVCSLEDVQPATTALALQNCRGSLVGQGLFEAKVKLKGQTGFPSHGKLYAFNSRLHGRPAILAHVYGTQPAPTSFTFTFEVRKTGGPLGTVLTAVLPESRSSGGGYVSGLSLTLSKVFSYKGHKSSYVSAGCPAPKGISRVGFPFAHVKLSFVGGRKVGETLHRSCRARG